MTKQAIGAVLVVVAVLTGCGKDRPMPVAAKSFEKLTDSTVKVDASSQRAASRELNSEGGKASLGDNGMALLSDFPQDVYLYPHSPIRATMKLPEGQQVVLETSDIVDKASQAYRRELKQAGWSDKSSIVTDQMSVLQYTKGNRQVTVHMNRSGEKTSIVLLVSTTGGGVH